MKTCSLRVRLSAASTAATVLMGNSLLDIIVFGRNAGRNASAKAKETSTGALTLAHVDAYAKEMKEAGYCQQYGIPETPAGLQENKIILLEEAAMPSVAEIFETI